jgi:hypothetical protein
MFLITESGLFQYSGFVPIWESKKMLFIVISALLKDLSDQSGKVSLQERSIG